MRRKGSRAKRMTICFAGSRETSRDESGGAAREKEGEGVEPPRPEDPPVFETGYRTSGSPSGQWLQQDSNLHVPD
jgi:hypothetical protein